MKFIILCLVVCCAVFFMAASAVPIEEAIPSGLEGASNEPINPTDDQQFLLKLKLLKKLLFLG